MPDAPPATSADDVSRRGVTRGELLTLALIIVVGVWLRAAEPDHLSVEHFDEGVYASNWFCRSPGLPEGKFPQQHLYAPPLLPEICDWVLFAFGSDPRSVMWINVVAGSLMIPVVWGAGRSWFGVCAGLLAAALCAVSDLHITLSRMVLTDVLFCLFLTMGVWSGLRAIQSGRLLWITVAGVTAALAWWTKYNGWLTLAITGAGLAGWLVFERPRGVKPSRPVLRWSATAVIAALLWSPLILSLQDIGGYSTVATNHARYLVGLSGWWDSLGSQVARLGCLEGGFGRMIGIVPVLALFLAQRNGRYTSELFTAAPSAIALAGGALFLPVLGGAMLAAGAVPTLVAFGVVSLVLQLRRQSEADREEVDVVRGHPLVVWTVLAWLLGMVVSIPLYTPYPRLALPVACGSWFAIGAMWPTENTTKSAIASGRWSWAATCLLTLVLVVLATAGSTWRSFPSSLLGIPAWQDRCGLATIAARLIDSAEADPALDGVEGRPELDAILYVFAEPALFYHLSARREQSEFAFLVQPIGDHTVVESPPRNPSMPTYVITGPHADAVTSDAERFSASVQAGRLQLVEEFPFQPSDLVLLDQLDTPGPVGSHKQTVRLYRLTTSDVGH